MEKKKAVVSELNLFYPKFSSELANKKKKRPLKQHQREIFFGSYGRLVCTMLRADSHSLKWKFNDSKIARSSYLVSATPALIVAYLGARGVFSKAKQSGYIRKAATIHFAKV